MTAPLSTMLATALLFVTSTILVTSQETPPVRQQFGSGELPVFLKIFDVNNDRQLSVEERQAYEKALREFKSAVPGAMTPSPMWIHGSVPMPGRNSTV